MRRAIEEYLQEGVGGKFYYRMVDTVLSRDKNWMRWKAEGCPPIERPPISVTEYLESRENAMKVYSNKRLRPSPMGSLDLKFLAEGESATNLERLKEPERFVFPFRRIALMLADAQRYSTPAVDSFMMGIMDDELDIDMAQTKEDKDSAVKGKASKVWRTLRLSSRAKLAEFDKIEDGRNLSILFDRSQAEGAKTSAEGEGEQEHGAGDTEKTNGSREQKLGSSSPKEAEATETIAS